MLKMKVIGFICLMVISCNCQQKTKSTNIIKNYNSQNYILSVLKDKNFEILQNTDVIVEFEIKKNLIDGTKDEYSNKLVLKDTLQKLQADELLKFLKNDMSYIKDSVLEGAKFEPKRQYLLKGKNGRLTLLLNQNLDKIGFINLEGQTLVSLSKEFTSFLKKINNKIIKS